MLRRLQSQKSQFNVYDWESERKEEVQRIKSICLYEPSLLKHKKVKHKKKTSTLQEPNKQLFNLINEYNSKPSNYTFNEKQLSENHTDVQEDYRLPII